MCARFAGSLAAAGTHLLPVRVCAERWRKSKKKFWRKLVKPLSTPASPDGVLLGDKAGGIKAGGWRGTTSSRWRDDNLERKRLVIAARSTRSPQACFCSLWDVAQRF